MGNPFSTRHTRPGALAYRFPPGQNAERLVEQLREQHWHGQIIGPHGSGKSTLLATLIPAIEATGKRTLLVVLHDGQRRMPIDLKRTPELSAGTLLIVDGYEQLARWNRYRLKQFCRRRELGLLVTAHAAAGLPDLFQTSTAPELAQGIVEELLAGQSLVTADEVRDRFAVRQGNLREMLFDLYDLYEQRNGE